MSYVDQHIHRYGITSAVIWPRVRLKFDDTHTGKRRELYIAATSISRRDFSNPWYLLRQRAVIPATSDKKTHDIQNHGQPM